MATGIRFKSLCRNQEFRLTISSNKYILVLENYEDTINEWP